MEASLLWLRYHQPGINALNVFPVPDGDTGTNMLLTMQGAWHEIEHSPEDNVGKVAQLVAHGALMGARGNSGVILSQLWRGFARSLDSKPNFGALDLAHAMREASETAYKGVLRPVEGTILTVSRAIADAAEAARREDDDLLFILEHIVDGGQGSRGQYAQSAARAQAGRRRRFGRTRPDRHSRRHAALSARRVAGTRRSGGGSRRSISKRKFRPMPTIDAGDVAQGYSYDVQCIIKGHDMDVEEARARIGEMGLSTLVVGDAETIKVHVHVPRPSAVLAYAETIGRLYDVVVEDMAAQYQQYLAGPHRPADPDADVQPEARRYRDPGGRAGRRADARVSKPGNHRHRAGRPDDESQHAGFCETAGRHSCRSGHSAAQQWQRGDGRAAGRGNLPEASPGRAVQDHSAGHRGDAGLQRSARVWKPTRRRWKRPRIMC